MSDQVAALHTFWCNVLEVEGSGASKLTSTSCLPQPCKMERNSNCGTRLAVKIVVWSHDCAHYFLGLAHSVMDYRSSGPGSHFMPEATTWHRSTFGRVSLRYQPQNQDPADHALFTVSRDVPIATTGVSPYQGPNLQPSSQHIGDTLADREHPKSGRTRWWERLRKYMGRIARWK